VIGSRASFTPVAPPALGRQLFEHLCQRARAVYPHVATGELMADMQVHLVNDGPVTFGLEA
jgi:D-aminoacyl-tRNA deacylase